MECYDFYKRVRDLKISDQRARDIDAIAAVYMVPRTKIQMMIDEATSEKDQKITELEEKLREQEALLSNPNLQMKKLIEEVVCEHLSLAYGNDPYSTSAELRWDKDVLGSITIRTYSED